MGAPNPRGVAETALDNLVGQFARPFDFLRELVQNAMDAGTPRVEVWIQVQGDDSGVARIIEVHVDDFGGGMDEAVIDGQLTRMFASTKEDDFTKIGKFGIGFTSIFAIEPAAVLLRTGRHGESWELLFRPDRSFDKVRLDDPVDGTRITLFKEVPASEVDVFVSECRSTLLKWCLHSDTPLWFGTATGSDAPAVEDAEGPDPFAAFAAADASPAATPRPDGALRDVEWERIDRPLDLDADLSVTGTVHGVEFIAGYARKLEYGFYNGGLTLVAGRTTSVFKGHHHRIGALSFKAKYRRLEHTLTRDNVLIDEHYTKVRRVLLRTRIRLRNMLLQRIADDAAAGRRLDQWHKYLRAELESGDLHATHGDRLGDELLFHLRGGRTAPLERLRGQERRLGCMLLESTDSALDDALTDDGLALLEYRAPATALLKSLDTFRFRFLGFPRPRRLVHSETLYVLPQPLGPDALTAPERTLLRETQRVLDDALPGRFRLRAADFGGFDAAQDEPLTMRAPRRDGPHRRERTDARLLELSLRGRSVLLNRHHGLFRAAVGALEAGRARVAVAGLTHALLAIEGFTDPSAASRALDAVHGLGS